MLRDALHAAVRQPSQRELVTGSSGAVVPLATLKHHIGQKLDDDDALITFYERVAQAWVEAYLGISILAQTWRQWYDGAPGAMVLLAERATAITAVQAYDTDDTATTVDAAVYQVDLVHTPSRLLLREGACWPTNLRRANSIAVEYTAGYAPATAVPEPVRMGIILLVAHMYRFREPVDVGSLTRVPFSVTSVLRGARLRTGAA